jgi:hypothetical protein
MKHLFLLALLGLTACGQGFQARSALPTQQSDQSSTSTTDTTTTTNTTTTTTPTFTSTDLQNFFGMLGTDLQQLYQAVQAGTGPGVTFDSTTSTLSAVKTIACPHGGSVSFELHSHLSYTLTSLSMTGPVSASAITFSSCSPGATLALNGALSIPSFTQSLQLTSGSLSSGSGTSTGQVQASGNLSVSLGALSTSCPATLMVNESGNLTISATSLSHFTGSGSGTFQLNGSLCGVSGSQQFSVPINF